MAEGAGAHWCARFAGSDSLDDLVEPFRSSVTAFLAALRAAGAAVTIAATFRPPERAYLMHWCCLVAGYRDRQQVFHQIAPGDVPPMAGVDIDWSCGGDSGAARVAALAMRKAYGIVFPAACVSDHTLRKAVDMDIAFKGAIMVRDALGQNRPAACESDLWTIGATYGVIKLPNDGPHWSFDGH